MRKKILKMSADLELAAYTNDVKTFASILENNTFDNKYLCDILMRCTEIPCIDIILFLKDRIDFNQDEFRSNLVQLLSISSLETNKVFFEHFHELLRPQIFDVFEASLMSTADNTFMWYYEKFNTVIDIGIETAEKCIFYTAANYGNMRALFWLFSMGFKPRNFAFYSLTAKCYRNAILKLCGKTSEEMDAELIIHKYYSDTDSYYVLMPENPKIGSLIRALLVISEDQDKNPDMLKDLIDLLYTLCPTRDEHEMLLKKIPSVSKYSNRFCDEIIPDEQSPQPSAPPLTLPMPRMPMRYHRVDAEISIAVPCNAMTGFA